jgi:sedoheptulokinase
MIVAGIDVGTTTIELALVDLDECRIRAHRSVPNRRLASDDPLAFLQDPVEIAAAVKGLLSREKEPVVSIGITGQVHGILYTDGAGKALSPLYTWLDRHGAGPLDKYGGKTPQELFAEKTGYTVPVGYGLLTHYANKLDGRVPPGAARLTGINEFVAGTLVGKPLEKTDASILAGYGVFDPVSNSHYAPALEEALSPPPDRRGSVSIHGEGLSFLGPAVPFTVAGAAAGIPVAWPVGDNQAGFFGAVARPGEECLVSIGTSGQLSVFSAGDRCAPAMELRPYFGLGYLHAGATLCAGKTWEVLADFVAETLMRAGKVQSGAGNPVDGPFDGEIFDLMKEAARETLTAREAAEAGREAARQADRETDALVFDTALNGTRRDPRRRGAIGGIGIDNFTLGNLALACVDGVIRELADFRDGMGVLFDPVRRIVAEGSAIRKNELFVRSLERQFCRPVRIPRVKSGAVFGAALAGACAAGHISLQDVGEIISNQHIERTERDLIQEE